MRPVIETFESGYLPSPDGGRSFDAFKTTLVQNTESSNDILDEYRIPESVPPFNQFKIGACVLNSWCGLLELLLGIEGQQVTAMSRLFPYALCRKVMGTIAQDSGTMPSLAADRFENVGCVPEYMWPYDQQYFQAPPGNKALDLYSAADDNKLKAAFRFTNQSTFLDDAEQSVRRNHPVVFAVWVARALMDAKPTDIIDIPDSKDVIGGHCMLLTGVRRYRDGRRDWRARNSWGIEYCDAGHVWIADRYAGSSTDNWTGTRMDALVL